MNKSEPGRWALWFSFPLAVLLATSSLGGIFLSSTYAGETRLHAALSLGNDIGNLLVIAPVLVIAAILALRGSIAARLVWMGAVAYVVYDFLYYALEVHFNSMFLVYCGVLGLSAYAFAGGASALPTAEIARCYGSRAPVKSTAIALLLVGLATIFHWLSEIVPALLAGGTPQAVRDSRLSTEPVAVLDLAFGTPAFIIAAILLLRRKPLGFTISPIVLTFLVLSSVVLAPMGIVMTRHGFASGHALCVIGLAIATVSAVLLALFLREAKQYDNVPLADSSRSESRPWKLLRF
jgi:hypothetical protein